MKNLKTLHVRGMALVLAILLVCGMPIAQMQQATSTNSGVNWEGRVVVAKGIGSPNPNLPQSAQRPAAIRAAKMIALRDALELVKGIALNSETTIENSMATNDVIRTKVSGFIQNFQFEPNPHYMSDGTVEITVTIPLDGVLMDAVLPTHVGAQPAITEMVSSVSTVKSVFTGLIIDAAGTGVTPAIAPKITDEDGKEIYGSAYVSREWATKYGMAGYAKSVANALALKDRVGDNPGKVKALRATGANKTDLVLSKKDAESIRSASENLKFLGECRVIIVVN